MADSSRRALSHLERSAIALYLGGVLWRVWYIFFFCPPTKFVYADMVLYIGRAKELLEPNFKMYPEFVTHPPAMIYLLSWMYRIDPSWMFATVVQFALSCLIPLMVGCLGWQTMGRRVGTLALGLASVYFPFIDYGGYFLSEVYVTPLFLLFLILFIRSMRAESGFGGFALMATAGVLLSLLGSFKSYFLLCGAFLCVSYLLFGTRNSFSKRFSLSTVLAVSMLPGLVWMTNYCSSAAGEFCVGAAKMGSDFLLGHYGRGGSFRWIDPKTGYISHFGTAGAEQRGLWENYDFQFSMADSHANLDQALVWVKARPLQAFIQSIEHLDNAFFATYAWPTIAHPHFVMVLASQHLFIFFIFLPALFHLRDVGAGRGILGFMRTTEALLLAPILALLLAMMIGTGEVRYRVPFDSIFLLYAAALYLRWFSPERETTEAVV